jgi:hypothetical protein
MSAHFDRGPILAQSSFTLPDGASGRQLDRQAAERGGQLLKSVLDGLQAGTLMPAVQPEGGSHQPWPRAEDFTVFTSWPAQRAWNFMRGTAEWGFPYKIPLPGGMLEVESPLDVAPLAPLDVPIIEGEKQVAIHFSPGVIWFRRGAATWEG